MYNELFHIGPFTVYGYGLMIAIGAILAVVVTEYRLKKAGLEYDFVYTLTIWAAIGGFLGAKLLYVIVELSEMIKDPAKIVNLTTGYVVYGGIIGGVFAGLLFSRVYKLGFWKYMDYVMPSIILAQAFGRIGCFLAGCCYGKETDSAFSIVFHNSEQAPNDVHLYPTQIMSSVWDFACFFTLVLMKDKKLVKKEGSVAAFYFILYGVGRFIIEFFRGDDRGMIGILSTSQFISVIMVIFGIVVLLTGKFRKEAVVMDVAGKAADTNEEERRAEE